MEIKPDRILRLLVKLADVKFVKFFACKLLVAMVTNERYFFHSCKRYRVRIAEKVIDIPYLIVMERSLHGFCEFLPPPHILTAPVLVIFVPTGIQLSEIEQ
jgi:hypothetical protein